jgi:predicted RNA-binding protein with RPS1 domain
MAIMPVKFQFAAPIFAFGLVAFGFLGMGPVTIAVDSYGPVTDNAQSVYELSQIESRRLNHPSDVLKEGQEVWVKLLGFDERGKVRLSMKVVDQTTGKEIVRTEAEAAEGG